MRTIALVLTTLLPSLSLAQPAPAPKAPTPTPPAKTPPPAPTPPAKQPAAPTKPPPPPAEVAETVGMFAGNWNFEITITATGMPGMDKPFKAKMAMPCKKIAGGTAVACDGKFKGPMGPFEGHFVVAWDPYTKAVHFMGITNQHEVHDHNCGQWDHGMAEKQGLTCVALKGGMGPTGDEITEELSFAFSKKGKELRFTSAVKDAKHNASITFEGLGKK
jgi:hypothetical protein